MTEISAWYHDHPEVWVEEEYLPRCIKLTMIMDTNNLQGFRATREIQYVELIHSKMDLMKLTLNGMLKQLNDIEKISCERELAELNTSVSSTGFKPIEFNKD